MASGLAAAQGFSRSGAPRDSEVASAASEPSAPQHLRLGTASACRALTPAEPLCPLRSLGKGGDTKNPAPQPIRCLFPGEAGEHRPQEPGAQPIGTVYKLCGLPRWFSGQESAYQCRRPKTLGLDPCVRRIPWRRRWQPTPIFLPEKSC